MMIIHCYLKAVYMKLSTKPKVLIFAVAVNIISQKGVGVVGGYWSEHSGNK